MKIRVLIVDDCLSIREMLEAYLKETRTDRIPASFEVTKAETLNAARALLSKEQFDAIVLDLDLPDGCGLDLLERAQIPVIVYAGNIAWRGFPSERFAKASHVIEKTERVAKVRRAIFEAVQQWQH